MSAGRAHLSVITLAALMLGGLAAWGFFNYVRAPRLTPELRGYQLAENLGCHGCHGPRGTGGTPNPGDDEEIPAWDGGMAMMHVKSEDEIREWILDGRPWRLVMRDSLEARAVQSAREEQHRAKLDSLSAAGDSVAAAAERESAQRDRVRADELLSRRLPSEDSSGPPKLPLRMPAFRGVVTEMQLEDLVAYYKAVADYGEMPEKARAGYRAAQKLGCFGCHGPGGLIGTRNPRSFKGYIPPWRGDDFQDLVRDDAELRSWILDGGIDRLNRNRAATYFTRRQLLKMPAYRDTVPDSTLATVMDYVKWVSGNVAAQH